MIYGIRGNATIQVLDTAKPGAKRLREKNLQPANFAEVKKDIQYKKLEEENKELKELLREWLTPNEAHKQTGTLKRVWKSYYKQQREWGDLVEA